MVKKKVALMRPIAKSKTRDELSEIVKRVTRDRERVIVRRKGRKIAAVIPLEDLRLLERLEEEAEDRRDVEAAKKALKDPGTIPWEKLKSDLGL